MLFRSLREASYPPAIKEEIDSVVKIGSNVVTYATNRELKDKLDRPRISTASSIDPLARGTLKIPKLSHGGGSDDAPNALANLLLAVSEQTQLPTRSESELIPAGDPRLFEYPLVFMHGRRRFSFTATERKAIATYIERGGFLMADSICANEQFATAFREEIKAIFPDAQLKRIPVSHPIFTQEYHGFDLAQVTLRDPQSRQDDEPLVARLTKIQPYLEGLEIDGRFAVIFSPYDISCAMENHASLECKGYVKQDAARLGINILLYALQR